MKKSHGIGLGISLLAIAAGQALIAFGSDFTHGLRPIDWAHWLLLVGAVGTACAVGAMTLNKAGKIGRILIIIGAVAFVGMSGIDFLLWALSANDTVGEAVDIALNNLAISLPFLQVGPAFFFIGLLLLGIEWWPKNSIGAGLLIFGTIVSGIGQGIQMRWLVAASFIPMLIGLYLITVTTPREDSAR